MANLLPFAVLLLVLAGPFAVYAGGDEDPTGSLNGVVDLTPDNFDSVINGAKHAIVEFYAPWCGHCKRLTPEYKKLGAMVEADPKLKGRVVIAKVDADAHRSIGEKFAVQGFPTIKYMARGKAATKDNAADYNGGRTAEAFMDFIKEKLLEDKGFARVEALDSIAAEFVDSADKAALISQAKEKAAALSGDDKSNAELYITIMEKVVAKGSTDYLKTEKARLEKMLASGSVHASKVEEMARKTSVIGSLLGEEE